MIVIQDDLWRADCIAGVRICSDVNGDMTTIAIVLIGDSDELEYEHDTEQEAADAYKKLCADFVADLRHMR